MGFPASSVSMVISVILLVRPFLICCFMPSVRLLIAENAASAARSGRIDMDFSLRFLDIVSRKTEMIHVVENS